MPVVVKYNNANRMYFVITDTNGYVGTGTAARAVTVTYDFTDSNGQTITFKHTYNANRQDMLDKKTSDGKIHRLFLEVATQMRHYQTKILVTQYLR